MEEKEKQVIEKVMDAILVACDKFEKGEEFNIEALQVLHESIRVLHHVKKMRKDY